MLQLIDIKKEYPIPAGTVQALNGVNLSFRSNEFVAILGPSGCGKTTFLNIVGGLDHYTSGDLVIQGKSTKAFRDRDWDIYRNHRIGFVFQNYNLIPHQTVLSNVELALTIAGISKEERQARAKEALIQVGLDGEFNKRPNQLSGGQMQRVAIARALVNNPDILLADEPTGALDSKTSVQIMELIKKIAGERLVIMVTHNPELANRYATRIIRLKDGTVESDSDPYSREEEALERSGGSTPDSERKEDKKREKESGKAKMGLFTSFSLSMRNLLTKKGRTVLTSIAGSIGIISVCLVLALSSGFQNYVKKTEEDMLSYYPLTISESSIDMTSIIAGMNSAKDMPDLEELENQVYINSFLTEIANGLTVQNDLSEKYLAYIREIDPNLYNAISYSYGVGLSNNLFAQVVTGDIEVTDEDTGEKVMLERKTRYMSLSDLKDFYTQELTMRAAEYAQLAYLVDYLGSVTGKMPGTSDFEAEDYGTFVQSQYDLIGGTFPASKNEVVLVVGQNNDMLDLTLAQLGFIEEKEFLSLFGLGNQEEDQRSERYHTRDFSEIIGKKFVLFGNDGVYEKSSDASGNTSYEFLYDGEKSEEEFFAAENGIELTVSGILRLKNEYTYGCLTSGLNFTEALIEEYIALNMQSKLVNWMNSSGIIYNGVRVFFRLPAENLRAYYSAVPIESSLFSGTVYYDATDAALRYVGGNDSPSGISFYLKDFESKESVLAILDAWNDTHEEAEQITYSDTVGTLMGMVQTILDVITYVLVAFTGISLVVSSVMIGIITYISVVERIKEIGVLRSLGARKHDIRSLFNAETFIIGLIAGVLGVMIAYLIQIPVNAIIFSLSGISGIAALPVATAVIMVLVSVCLTLISGLIPASAAAKKDPVIALRTE